jgi:diguanylate cyclase (GGDEF)-like protein
LLDVATMRVVFALIGVTMLVLFGSTYRSTRVPASGWWCAALGLFMLAAVFWIFNDTAVQRYANPLGNVASVCGAIAVWLGARSSRGVIPRWFVLAPLPIATGIVAYLDHPERTIWPGGAFYLVAMTLNFALASADLWRTCRDSRLRGLGNATITTRTLAWVSSIVTVFYLGRTVTFAALGPDGKFFEEVFGPVPNTLLMIVMLVAASHTMGSLSHEQLVFDLRQSAEHDDLTGLLNRAAFFQLAARELGRVPQAAVVVADLDHFKQINDRFGHSYGDLVLTEFADVIRRATRSTDLHARFGGEEFVILMPGASVQAAEMAADSMNRLLISDNPLPDGERISASFGIAAIEPHTDLATAIDYADAALYQAKNDGRGRGVIHPGRARLTSAVGGE